jgi:hypothetical protein
VGGTVLIGATSLTPTDAYVSESAVADPAATRIVAIALG